MRVFSPSSAAYLFPITCGVPQGSYVSPTLYNIFTKPLFNVLDHLGITYNNYADDTQILLAFTGDYDKDLALINRVYIIIQAWMATHCLCLNYDKTELIILGTPTNLNKSGPAYTSFLIDGNLIKVAQELNDFLQNIHFKTPAGVEFAFDDTGSVPTIYDIVNHIYFTNKTPRSILVGEFDPLATPGHQLFINESAIQWNSVVTDHQQVPRSACSESCLPGYRKAAIEGRPICCFYCVPCAEGEFSNSTNMETCIRCPSDQWPNVMRDGCIQKTVIFLSYSDSLGMSLAFIAIALSIASAGVLGIFLRHRTTCIVKANNRSLSYTLLISLMLAFLCSLLFIGQPMSLTCLIQQIAFGIIFTVSVSSVLAKTITVFIAFNATKPGSRLSTWLGNQVSVSIVLVCTLGEVVICISWLLTNPPHPHTDLHSQIGKIILQCEAGSVAAYYSVIGYMGLLAFASFVVAFLVRNLPDRFNEAKIITFSMLVFGSVWVSFIPAYLSTNGSYMVAVEIFAMLASSAGLLGCIFIPKCYIILLMPDLNTRETFTVRNPL
ncbi:vomeronasal type-2 receptor 26-like [Ambystoma mexicanum]|uniref:vomeronasal type-2 receptor 26-like n=1 Tax=Ambystoma mexicanum TaxID=8296 RepID=UPI0037E71DAF